MSRGEAPAHHDEPPPGDDAAAQARKLEIERAVAGFRRGEREKSFRILFDLYYRPIQRFFAKRVFSAEDRLDLTQETFLGVYKGLEGYRGEAQFGTWVFRIAYNTHWKWLRRMKSEEAGQEAASPGFGEHETGSGEDAEPVALSSDKDPLEQVLQDERQQLLRAAIEELPEQMRRCTELRILQDLSYREIATAMRLSIETVKVHLFQARKKLKSNLKDSLEVIEL